MTNAGKYSVLLCGAALVAASLLWQATWADSFARRPHFGSLQKPCTASSDSFDAGLGQGSLFLTCWCSLNL